MSTWANGTAWRYRCCAARRQRSATWATNGWRPRECCTENWYSRAARERLIAGGKNRRHGHVRATTLLAPHLLQRRLWLPHVKERRQPAPLQARNVSGDLVGRL